MSCNYADGLSPYDNKGILGTPERFDDEETVNTKCRELADLILSAKKVVIHTGAGISTAAGIPDFRGPNGVWILERRGEKPTVNVNFDEAIPTKTHMALKALVQANRVHFIVSQNIDGLHLRSGLERKFLAEMHGNMFLEECLKCKKQFVRSTPAPTVGKKITGNLCKNARPCRGGQLIDNILDWDHDLPDKDLELAFMHSAMADLNICLGTTLQIIPSGNLPLKNQKYGGKLVICNLQPTKHDNKAALVISTYVDKIMEKICKFIGVEIPEYDPKEDPTKQTPCDLEWTIPGQQQKALEKEYDKKIKELNLMIKKRKSQQSSLADDLKNFGKKKKKEELKKEENETEQ